jgi:hypothetical protein
MTTVTKEKKTTKTAAKTTRAKKNAPEPVRPESLTLSEKLYWQKVADTARGLLALADEKLAQPVVLTEKEKEERRRLVRKACGSLAHMEYSVDDYLREKHAGIEAEMKMAEENRLRWERKKQQEGKK